MKKWIPFILLVIALWAFYIFRDQEFNIYTTEEPVESLTISSSSDRQVCELEYFDLSSIWITITYQSGKKEQVTLSKEMISKKDFKKLQKSGNHTIKVNIGNKNIDLNLFLYDQNNLKNQKIYYYDNDSLNYVQANSIYEIATPEKENCYFYNWFSNEERTIRYEDEGSTTKVVKLYAKFTDEITYRVRFFHQDILIYEEYVKKGGYATPPLMSSFENFKFIGWDKSFSNVQEDLDIYSIYALPGSKVVYYNYDNEVFLENVISEEFVLNDPILPNHDGYVFKGWVKVKNINQNFIEAHPIFQKEQFEVVFYKWQYYYDQSSYDDDAMYGYLLPMKDGYLWDSSANNPEFLYSTWVTAGESVSCNYEIDGYKKIAYSIGFLDNGIWQEKYYTPELTISNVTGSMQVCVLYQVQRYYSLMDKNVGNNHIYNIPFDANPLYFGYSGEKYLQWIKSENGIYETCSEGDEAFSCVTEEYGRVLVNFYDFCSNPTFCIGNKLNQYVLYEWYYDENKIDKVEDITKLKIGTVVYGKQVEPQLYADESCFSFHKTIINGIEGYQAILKNPFCLEQSAVVVPEEYDSLPVIEVYAKSTFYKYVYISKNVMSVDLPKELKIYADDANPYFYSENGNLITK